MENFVIEFNYWQNQLEQETNLITELQDTYSKLNKVTGDTSEINNLKCFIVETIKKEKLQQNEICLAFKIYYKILEKLNLTTDYEFVENFNNCLFTYQPFVLNAVLSTNFQQYLQQKHIKELCDELFLRCISENSKNLIVILKTMNLFNKKYPESAFDISLENIYFCLQNDTNFRVRDEILHLYERTVQKSATKACQVTLIVLNNMPWTNKNKFYILSVIFKIYSFEYIQKNVEFKKEKFFEGVRLSLMLKHLFSASQCLIKSLNQSSKSTFIEFICKTLENASEKEMVNFNSQWWKYIENREDIYFRLDVENIFNNLMQSEEARNIVICYLFRNNMLKSHENTFYRIIMYFIKRFENFSYTAQSFIYKFVIDTLKNMNLMNKYELYNDVFNFFIQFFKSNINNSLPEFRQTMIEKIPDIVNFTSKLCSSSELISTKSGGFLEILESFYRDIKNIFEYGILHSSEYQPIIFSLKLINQILKTIYVKLERKNTKNCNTLQNQNLIAFLNKKNILNFKTIQNQLIQLLNNDSVEYDDVQSIAINVINSFCKELVDIDDILKKCMQKCKSVEYENCRTASLFASLLVNRNFDITNNLHKFCFRNLSHSLKEFEDDPFFMCKTKYHLFGLINCLNILYSTQEEKFSFEDYEKIVNICLDVNKIILKLLNVASKNVDENTSASFEIMDESLELLLRKSKIESDNNVFDRKFLLLSFWMTLKATCDLASTIGINLISSSEKEESLNLKLFEQCLDINVNVLYKCRHKGAIEAAGVALGTLVRHTSLINNNFKFYKTLFKCFNVLFSNVSQNSLTRRGAGLSIMLHHLLKNDMHKSKLLFRYAMKVLMSHVQKSETPIENFFLKSAIIGENIDALMLHYLCVLVKDTELKNFIVEYYDDIMMTAIKRIEHREWCVRNAALQLFGGLTPKIVGQKQSGNSHISVNLSSQEVTLKEISIKLPKTLLYMLQYCNAVNSKSITERQKSNSTIILFLEFLSNIEYLKLDFDSTYVTENILIQYRELFWLLLSNKCEKIRILSASCFVCFHNFSNEIMSLILNIIRVFYLISDPNFEHGLLFTIIEGVNMIKNGKFLNKDYQDCFKMFRTYFINNYRDKQLSYYTRIKFLDLLILLEFDLECQFVKDSIMGNEKIFPNEIELKHVSSNYDFGYFLWYEKVTTILLQIKE